MRKASILSLSHPQRNTIVLSAIVNPRETRAEVKLLRFTNLRVPGDVTYTAWQRVRDFRALQDRRCPHLVLHHRIRRQRSFRPELSLRCQQQKLELLMRKPFLALNYTLSLPTRPCCSSALVESDANYASHSFILVFYLLIYSLDMFSEKYSPHRFRQNYPAWFGHNWYFQPEQTVFVQKERREAEQSYGELFLFTDTR